MSDKPDPKDLDAAKAPEPTPVDTETQEEGAADHEGGGYA